MNKDCTCDKWKEHLSSINGCIQISSIHHCPLPKTYEPFVYCPWCGSFIGMKLEDFKNAFGCWSDFPSCSRSEWIKEVNQGNTNLGYWEFVEVTLRLRGD